MEKRIHNITLGALISLIVLVLLQAETALAEDRYAIVSSNAKVFMSQNFSGDSVKVQKKTAVSILESMGETTQIRWRGKTCYIKSAKLKEIDVSESREAIFSKQAKVYERPTQNSKYIKAKKSDGVTLLCQINDLALVEYEGQIGYTSTKYITEKPVEPDITYSEYDAVVVDAALRVYKSPSEKSNKLGTLNEGAEVRVTAYTDIWARIENDNKTGYVKIDGIKKKEVAPKNIFDNGSLSSEQKIYYFLTKELNYNPAAACGALSNIKCESGFRPEALNSSSGAYGICQWLGSRKTNLQSYCEQEGYDYQSLEGQCMFLKYELENKYTGTHNYLKAVDDSAQGAYEAGYYWCYNFEIPGDRANNSVKRGNIAKTEFWAKYGK